MYNYSESVYVISFFFLTSNKIDAYNIQFRKVKRTQQFQA